MVRPLSNDLRKRVGCGRAEGRELPRGSSCGLGFRFRRWCWSQRYCSTGVLLRSWQDGRSPQAGA